MQPKVAALKAAGDYIGSTETSQKCIADPFAQPLQTNRQAKRIHASVRSFPYKFPGNGHHGPDSGCEKSQLVNILNKGTAMTDPIADYLTRIRNAVMANHRIVEIPASNIKKEITKILFDQGYILNYKFEEETKPGLIKIALKYHPVTKQPAISNLTGSANQVCANMLVPRTFPGF